ncbi:MAG: TadE/TadG family type IV pilus assembly protein [Terracidiphilus sp.]
MKIPGGLQNQARKLKYGLSRLFAANNEAASARPTRGRSFAALLHSDEGNPLVEMALVVPALLTVMTGLITFAMAFNNQLTLTTAVGSAGQYLSQIRTSTSNPCADTYAALTNAAPGLNPANITMSVTMNGTKYTENSCSGLQTQLVQGSSVTVYATYPCNLEIYKINFTTACKLAAKVTEYEY